MKSNSTERTLTLLPLNDGNYHFNYNIIEGVREEQNQDNEITTRPNFDYDTVFIEGEPTKQKILDAMLSEIPEDERTQQKIEEFTILINTELSNAGVELA